MFPTNVRHWKDKLEKKWDFIIIVCDTRILFSDTPVKKSHLNHMKNYHTNKRTYSTVNAPWQSNKIYEGGEAAEMKNSAVRVLPPWDKPSFT